MTRLFYLGSAIVLVCAAVAQAVTVTLTPDKDNTLVQTSAGNLSNGAGNAIYAGRTLQGGNIDLRRGLLHFNLSSIPAGAVVTDASLRLVAEDIGQNGNRTMTLHKVLQDWGQGTSNAAGRGGPATNNDATWVYRFYNTANPSASPMWSTAGGSFSAASSGSVICPNLGGAFTMTGNSTSQMVADIRAWLADPLQNFGWELRGDESAPATAKKIYSRENFTPANRPQLTITYVVPEPSSVLVLGVITGYLTLRRRP